MKKENFLFAISVLFISHNSFSFEKVSEKKIIENFVIDKNRKYGEFINIDVADVLVDKQAIDGNKSSDLMVYSAGSCGALRGCELDIYLCMSNDPLCSEDQYCYAGTLYEGK